MVEQLQNILNNNTSYLSDLHTHLLGMGNTKFWINRLIDECTILPTLTVINDIPILPTHDYFCRNPEIRKQLCPLIWNHNGENGGAFISADETARFFDLLIVRNFPKCSTDEVLDSFDGSNRDKFMELIDDQLKRELEHYNLSFGDPDKSAPEGSSEGLVAHDIAGRFTYDVVLTLKDLSEALGATGPQMVECDDLIQSKVEEKLGLHTYWPPIKSPFRRWIVFNAREQKFQVVKGITVEILRELITVRDDPFKEIRECARAHIKNAFSMHDLSGSSPRLTDFNQFHGSFTPEFYPRRFALKDSLYSQRLDILAALLVYVLRRYQECVPPVQYCELSVGVGDLRRAWVFDVLCSFSAYSPAVNENPLPETSFRHLILEKKCFPYLHDACVEENGSTNKSLRPNVTYKFVAGFKRQTIEAHGLSNRFEAIRLLNDSPNLAIHYMLQEIVRSEKGEPQQWPQKSSQAACPTKKGHAWPKLSRRLLKPKATKLIH